MSTSEVTEDQWTRLKKVMLGPTVTAQDLRRWGQGFVFCETPSFGLRQSDGGPCGVLAAVQAELLYHLFFAPDAHSPVPASTSSSSSPLIGSLPPQPDASMITGLLVKSLVGILSRARASVGEDVSTSAPFVLVGLPSPDFDLSTALLGTQKGLLLHTLSSECEATEYLQRQAERGVLGSASGVLLFLLSVVWTHGLETTKEDMDDCENSMLGQFGHCTQDLINLLLSGRSVSNVFDGNVPLGGGGDESGFMLKGIQQRSRVGYLSQLEAMRYCAVGENYKKPEVPVWVLGSSSHFTVLFSLQKGVNEETSEEKMLSKAQQAFKAADREECGFVQSNRLDGILVDLGLPIVGDAVAMGQLRTLLAMDGDLILWQTFWEVISQLMSGIKTLEALVADSGVISTTTTTTTTTTNSTATAARLMGGAANGGTRPRSDSDIAREMQQEFDFGEAPAVNVSPAPKAPRAGGLDFSALLGTSQSSTAATGSSSSATPVAALGGLDFSALLGAAAQAPASAPAPAPAPAPAFMSTPGPAPMLVKTDSVLARELQQQFDSEDGGAAMDVPGTAGVAVLSSPTALLSPAASSVPGAITPDRSTAPDRQTEPVERKSDTWQVFHINGMETSARRARLAPLKMRTQSVVSSIGQAVSLNSEVSDGGGGAFALEEIMRTRWLGCCVDCGGQPPPSVD